MTMLVGQGALAPMMPLGIMSLARRQHQANQLDEAERHYRKLTYIAPPEPANGSVQLGLPPRKRGGECELTSVTAGEAYRMQGGIAYVRGNPHLALSFIRDAVKASPSMALYRQELGHVSFETADDATAIAECRRSVALEPNNPHAYFTMGLAAQKQLDPDRATHCYHRFLCLAPNEETGYSNLGVVLQDQGRMREALAAYRRAAEIAKPNTHMAVASVSNALWACQFLEEETDRGLYERTTAWLAQVERPSAPFIGVDRDPERKLRIGYVCSRFQHHVTTWSIEPVLDHHDRSQFELIAYQTDGVIDEHTVRMQAKFDRWRDLRGKLPHEQAAEIHRDNLDIMVSLTGYLMIDRIPFASKVAPIQTTYINHVGTTGLRAFDYRLTDPWFDPEGMSEDAHTETLVRLQTGCNIFRAAPYAPEVQPAPALRNGYITFGSFNQLPKVTDSALALWAKVLEAVPGSRMVVKSPSLNSPAAQRIMIERAERCGIPRARFIAMPGNVSEVDHLAAYSQIDIGLDPIPFTGGVTTAEALWMGVPVVTVTGPRSVHRIGASMVRRGGFPELVTDSHEAYVAAAVKLAGNLGELARARETMRERVAASPLYDAEGHTRELEQAYRTMWRAWCAKPFGRNRHERRAAEKQAA